MEGPARHPARCLRRGPGFAPILEANLPVSSCRQANLQQQAMNGNHTLAQAYQQVMTRIRLACQASGRDPASVALLAVSKTRTAAEVAALAALGQRAMGENYLQEALDKQATLAGASAAGSPASAAMPAAAPAMAEAASARPAAPDAATAAARATPAEGLVWHFIGPIQSNKTRKIAEHFDWVHSVESLRIAQRLSAQRPEHLAPLNICLQVNVSGEASKSGCAPSEAPALALAMAALPGLRLRGLMAIPEPTSDVCLQRQRFDSLRALFEQIRSALAPLPERPAAAEDFDTLSMGMSDDLEAAIAAGSTMIRIGTAIFGPRQQRAAAHPPAASA